MKTYNELTPLPYHLMKYIIIGDIACGKSCITKRFTSDIFTEQHDITIGVEFDTKTIKIGDKIIKLQIWDTAGQETFRSITRSYYKSSNVCFILYDVTRRETFENITTWYEELMKNSNTYPVVVLVGNKIDKRSDVSRSVTTEEGEALADKLDTLFLETSAKDDINIKDVFYVATKKYLEKNGVENLKECSGSVLNTGYSIYGENSRMFSTQANLATHRCDSCIIN
tara:strand:+ start:1407 stop:2084 length:678 start_codon:yes stop_codon:yes gene_type:complete